MKIELQIKPENKPEINPRLIPQLRLTPQMRQAIDVLQLPLPELRAFLDRELNENPLLEEVKPEFEDELKSEHEIDRFIEQVDGGAPEVGQAYDIQEQKRKDYLESCLTQPVTLTEHLLSQLRMLNLSGLEQKIGEMIIGCLDSNGYLRFSLSEIAQMFSVEMVIAERVLSLIQEFDPQGVGARNLEECLLIQLKARGREDNLAGIIVNSHFFDLEMRRHEKIARSLGVSITEIKQARDEISRLEPKPGRNFGWEQAISIIPDVILHKIDDDYLIENNAKQYLGLRISPLYKRLIKEDNTSRATRKYLKGKLNSALWLIKAIRQRHETIIRIVECIISLQKDFLDRGHLYLRPLQLKDVADILGIHKSTVSRAIADKYIQTPQGILKLRYFFDEGIKSDYQTHSHKSIKARIEDLINEEDSRKPLSDEKIVSILREQGIQIARRTVTKYREQLRVLPSYLRKQ